MDIELRPIRPDDAERLHRMFHRLSPTTVYQRFFQLIPHPRPSTLRHLATVDHLEREALVAVHDDEIVGVARWDRVSATGAYEVAVLVEDAWQRHGVGRLLITELGRRAQARGVDAFSATVLTENQKVQRFIRATAPEARFTGWGTERDVLIPLRTTA